MEYASLKSLRTHIEEAWGMGKVLCFCICHTQVINPTIDAHDARDVVRGVCEGLKYLHDTLRTVHGDVKPSVRSVTLFLQRELC